MGAVNKKAETKGPLPYRFIVLALVSAAGLIFEITLTRVFSLYFQYHFFFLAVSLAIFGLHLALLIAAAGIAWFPSASSIWPQTALALLPFVLMGRLMAFIFARDASASGQLYAADLIGTALGVLAALELLSVPLMVASRKTVSLSAPGVRAGGAALGAQRGIFGLLALRWRSCS